MLYLKQITGIIIVASLAANGYATMLYPDDYDEDTVQESGGVPLNGLRVKFGWSGALENVEYFFKIPRTIMEAESEGWKRTVRPPGPMPELRMYCTSGRNVCPMYDVSGFVAGLQIAFPKGEFQSHMSNAEKKMQLWKPEPSPGEPTRDYWYLTQFYVTEDTLKAGSGPSIENGATLQEDGVWVRAPWPSSKLLKIPISETELRNTAFRKQNCIPNMGTHYYYNLTEQMKCQDIFPWFALTNKGQLIGTGIFLLGHLNAAYYNFNKWFEQGPFKKESVKLTTPNAPKCLTDMAKNGNQGALSLHIYYVDKPWNIRCKDGDSAKPAPIMERLLFSGYRYASAVSDNVKKLFSSG